MPPGERVFHWDGGSWPRKAIIWKSSLFDGYVLGAYIEDGTGKIPLLLADEPKEPLPQSNSIFSTPQFSERFALSRVRFSGASLATYCWWLQGTYPLHSGLLHYFAHGDEVYLLGQVTDVGSLIDAHEATRSLHLPIDVVLNHLMQENSLPRQLLGLIAVTPGMFFKLGTNGMLIKKV